MEIVAAVVILVAVAVFSVARIERIAEEFRPLIAEVADAGTLARTGWPRSFFLGRYRGVRFGFRRAPLPKQKAWKQEWSEVVFIPLSVPAGFRIDGGYASFLPKWFERYQDSPPELGFASWEAHDPNVLRSILASPAIRDHLQRLSASGQLDELVATRSDDHRLVRFGVSGAMAGTAGESLLVLAHRGEGTVQRTAEDVRRDLDMLIQIAEAAGAAARSFGSATYEPPSLTRTALVSTLRMAALFAMIVAALGLLFWILWQLS